MEMELEERGDQEPLPPGGNAPPPLAPPPPRSGEVPGVVEEVPGVVMPQVVAGEAGVVVAKVAGVEGQGGARGAARETGGGKGGKQQGGAPSPAPISDPAPAQGAEGGKPSSCRSSGRRS